MPSKPQTAAVLLGAVFFIAAAASRAAANEDLLLSLDACIVDTTAREKAEAAEDEDAFENDDEAVDGDDSDGADESELSELEMYCPEVHAGLDDSPLAPYLEPDWENRITASKLERLRALLAAPPAPAARALDTGSIADIVERVRTSQVEQERSLWQRFKDWVRELADQQARSEDSGWFEDWLREHWPSDRIMKVVAYGILALLVGGLGWIVWVELRAAGVLVRRRGAAQAPAGPVPEDATGKPQTLVGASDVEVPGILIGLLLEQLRRLGRLQDGRIMTHRELGRAVQFESAADGETFAGLLQLSEHLRYAPTAPPTSSLRTVVDAARGLLDGLARQAVQTA